jgi:hypothetical protein
MYDFDGAASSRDDDFIWSYLYERDCEHGFLLKAIHLARVKFLLALNTIDVISDSLKCGLTDADAALAWLHDEGIDLDLDLASPAKDGGVQ